LAGDRYQGGGTRQETLLQWEHLSVLTSLTSRPVTPELLRRNLVVKGINLLALKDRQFTIGQAVFQTTGLCHPCSRMEQTLGFGGYNAMRGHGGLTAVILEGGLIRLNDSVIALPKDADR
ncbi:MAG: MOSC domain-containing protein, partial [Gammaproteobacteria bacterium]